MIFLSHNHKDKAIVEPIAIKLAAIFGTQNIFYDSWSMQPGDGIIDKMNSGLSKATHFFLFVSSNSMQSNMVRMEWQNAIYMATHGACKVIPVRLDSQSLPPVMAQTLFIDLYSIGIDAALGQMVNVIQGNSTFSPANNSFSNLTYEAEFVGTNTLKLKIRASHYLEPISNFYILVKNDENEVSFSFPGTAFHVGGFNSGLRLNNGVTCNGHLVEFPRGITPTMPLSVEIHKRGDADIKFIGILHQITETDFKPLPCSNPSALK